MKPAQFKRFIKDLIEEDEEFFYDIVAYKGACLSDAERFAWVDWAKETISERYDLQDEIAEQVVLSIENHF